MAKGRKGAGSPAPETVRATYYEVSYECDGPDGRLAGTFLTLSAAGVDRKVRAHAGVQLSGASFACVQREAEMSLDDFAAMSGAVEPASVEDVPPEG